jgi:predicted acylesterase/phospholipase RssA
LEALEENGLLKAVHEYIGISAGALCALCLCIGCSLPELRKIILFLDFALIRDVDPETALNFTETFGIDTGANVKKLLSAILRGKKIDPHCTFGELESKKLGPSLRVIATNMNTCRPQEFSAKCSPGAELIFAVQASMSIPIYFTPVRDPESGHLFLDGGMMCSSPFKYLTDEEKRYTLSVVFGDDRRRFRNDSVAFLPAFHVFADLDDVPAKFMPQHDGIIDRPRMIRGPLMQVRSTDTHVSNFQEHILSPDRGLLDFTDFDRAFLRRKINDGGRFHGSE